MDYVFARHGVDQMLERGEIDFIVLSHWHLDHFWGIESTLKHNPRLTIYAPPHGLRRTASARRKRKHRDSWIARERRCPSAGIACLHEGDLILTGAEGEDGGGIYRLMPGVALKMFDAPMLLQVRGENVLYVNVEGKGIVPLRAAATRGS